MYAGKGWRLNMEEKRNIITEKEITSAKGGMALILVFL